MLGSFGRRAAMAAIAVGVAGVLLVLYSGTELAEETSTRPRRRRQQEVRRARRYSEVQAEKRKARAFRARFERDGAPQGEAARISRATGVQQAGASGPRVSRERSPTTERVSRSEGSALPIPSRFAREFGTDSPHSPKAARALRRSTGATRAPSTPDSPESAASPASSTQMPSPSAPNPTRKLPLRSLFGEEQSRAERRQQWKGWREACEADSELLRHGETEAFEDEVRAMWSETSIGVEDVENCRRQMARGMLTALEGDFLDSDGEWGRAMTSAVLATNPYFRGAVEELIAEADGAKGGSEENIWGRAAPSARKKKKNK